MSTIVKARLIIAGVGLALWWFGLENGIDAVRWLGIALIVVSVLLRWVKARPPEPPGA